MAYPHPLLIQSSIQEYLNISSQLFRKTCSQEDNSNYMRGVRKDCQRKLISRGTLNFFSNANFADWRHSLAWFWASTHGFHPWGAKGDQSWEFCSSDCRKKLKSLANGQNMSSKNKCWYLQKKMNLQSHVEKHPSKGKHAWVWEHSIPAGNNLLLQTRTSIIRMQWKFGHIC